MDPVLIGIAGAAGSALVQAMTSDVWTTAKQRLLRIMARGDKRSEAEVARDLDATAAKLRGESSPRPELIAAEQERWAGILERFLAEHTEAADNLRYFVADTRRQLSAEEPATVVQQITAQGNAYTAGRDQHIAIRADEDEH